MRNVPKVEVSAISQTPQKPQVQLSTTTETVNFFRSVWDESLLKLKEQFYAVFLDRENRVICWRCLHTGTIDQCDVDSKAMLQLAKRLRAAKLIMAHNHPGGMPHPSKQDKKTTALVKFGCSLFNIQFVDHIILTGNTAYSFAASGKLDYRVSYILYSLYFNANNQNRMLQVCEPQDEREPEEWKDIEGYEGLYQISNWGRVKTLERIYYSGRNYSRENNVEESIMKYRMDKGGYLYVNLCKDAQKKTHKLHRLSALHFVNNPLSSLFTQVNHIDGIKSNNYYKNLEWCTAKHNMMHAFDMGLIKSVKGESHYNSILSELNVKAIRTLIKAGEGNTEIAKKFGISDRTVFNIKSGHSWKHLE